MPGDLWWDVEGDLTPEEHDDLWRQFGRLVKAISSVLGEAFGLVQAGEPFPTWSLALLEWLVGRSPGGLDLLLASTPCLPAGTGALLAGLWATGSRARGAVQSAGLSRAAPGQNPVGRQARRRSRGKVVKLYTVVDMFASSSDTLDHPDSTDVPGSKKS